MPSRPSPRTDYQFRRLTGADADSIYDLYKVVFAQTPFGFLARRVRADFDWIFASEAFSGGAFQEDQLVGYQIFNTVREVKFDEQRYRRPAEIIATERVVYGKGTAIADGHQGNGLGPRLSAFVADLARARGFTYRIGQIHVGNLNSVKYQLASGRNIIGISRDEFGLNFLTSGYLGQTASRTEIGLCPVDDLAMIAEILETQKIIAVREIDGKATFVVGEVVELPMDREAPASL